LGKSNAADTTATTSATASSTAADQTSKSVSSTKSSKEESESNKSTNTLQLENINQTIEQVTGVHEITALKQAVTDASDHLQRCTQHLQDLRQKLDVESVAHQELSAQYHEMMNRRHEWNETDVQSFAQLTAQEGRARSQVDEVRTALQRGEEAWHAAQTAYLDAVRRRYHEEQVWQDKWRVLGTYWTWTLIGLNSVVFIVGQVLHYRRETSRLQSLQDMIKPLTEAAVHENKEREQKALEEVSKIQTDALEESSVNDAPVADTGDETEKIVAERTRSSPDETLSDHIEKWQESWKTLAQSFYALGNQTIKIVGIQTTEVSRVSTRTIQTISRAILSVTQKWIREPASQLTKAISSAILQRGSEGKSAFSDEHKSTLQSTPLHWPSAVLGAVSATLAFTLITLVRSNRS
jgi:hypothetical protein